MKDILALDREFCSYGDTVHYANPPKVFSACEGSYLYDESGTPYLDLQMWYSAASFGYRNERLRNALVRQLDSLPQLASQYLHSEKVEVAAEIAGVCLDRFETKGRVHFNVGGAQAVEDSLKLIRRNTGKTLNFAFMGGYHGRTLGASAITSSYRYRRPFGAFADRAQFIPFPYCFRCPYQKRPEDCGLHCVKEFERLFESEYYSIWDPKARECEFAAFYVEAVQGTGGYIIPPDGYFPALKKILDEHNVLLVDDEIQMGFFRTGKFWAIEHFGVKPDVIVFGKALTNGLNPLSGIWAKEDLISPDKFPPGSTHSTFSSNPLGTAVALEVLRMIAEEDLQTSIKEKGAYFLEQITNLKMKHPGTIGDVSGIGLALRIEICKPDGFTPDKEMTDRIFQEGLHGDLEVSGKRYGLVLDIGGYYKNIITIAPAFDITRDEIDLAMELLDRLVIRCVKAGS